jgi:ankyrin repeat protein
MAAEEAIEAVHRAVREGDAVSVARMLDEDPRLLSSMWEHGTLLTMAVRNGHVYLMRLLLERGAEINQANAHGSTALHFAAVRGHEEIVSILLTSGVDPTRKGSWGQSALMQASLGGHVAVIRLLLRSMGGGGLNERNEYGITALWYACVCRSAGVVRALLLAGADHIIADNDDRTPIQIAEESEHHECVDVIQVSNCSCHAHKVIIMAMYARPVVPVLSGVAPHNLCLCCSGGRASCSVPMSSTGPGRYTKTPPHASKPLQPQCPPT